MVLAHPTIVAAAPEDVSSAYEERAAIRTWLGVVDTYEAEHAAAREVLAGYIHENRAWLPEVRT